MAVIADIVKIEAPASVPVGETVVVDVHVKNITSQYYDIKVTGTVDSIILSWQFDYLNVAPQETVVFKGWFTMPGGTVTVYVKTWYWDGSQWRVDDILGEAPPEAPAASIVSRVLDYEGMKVPLPVANVPQGTSAKLRVTVRNDMSITQRLGIGWSVVDPNGTVIQTYSTWEVWPYTDAGKTHEFVGPTFLISVTGTYWTRIDAFIHPDLDPVDEYYAVLCTVVPQEIPTGLRNTSIDTVYGTYDPLDTVSYALGYDYKGKAQSGTLQIELGTGVWPFFTPEVALDPVSCSFVRKDDWDRVTASLSFRLPDTVRRGQTYTARLTLKTADGLSDNDINYSVFKVSDPAVPTTELTDIDFNITYGEYDLGNPLVIRLSYRYQGVAQSGQVSVIIGKGIIFSPVYTYTPQPVSLAQADVLTTRTEDIEVTLPRTLEPGQVYSVKVVLETADGKNDNKTKGSQFKIISTAVPEDPGVGQYRLVKDHTYPLGETYSGNASEATVEFTIAVAQLPGTDWISEQVINAFESSVTEYGSHMLRLVVSEREEGLLAKGYKVVAVAIPPEGTAGQLYTAQGIVDLAYVSPQFTAGVWALIVISALALIAIVVSMLEPTVRNVVWGEGGVVEGIVGGIGDVLNLLPYVLVFMILGLVMEQTRQLREPPGTPTRPKPITEAVITAAKHTAELAETGWEEARKFVGNKREDWAAARAEDRERKAAELRRAEEREVAAKRKKEEATTELSRRREEKARQEGQW